MSIRIMTRVWQTECDSHTEKLVLLALADNANDEGFCWPSVATMCRKTGLTERPLQAKLRLLESKGWIRTHQRNGHSSTYLLQIPTPAATAPPLQQHPTPAVAAPPPPLQQHPEPSLEPSRETSSALDFFPQVPREEPKAKPAWVPSALQLRLGALFGRRMSTQWSAEENKALKTLPETDESDFQKLERYYRAKLPEGKDYRKRKLVTLLNGFSGELDIARRFKEPTCL